MCKFLSAIVTQTDELICMPEATDSHEDLIEWTGLRDGGPTDKIPFVRVELAPKDRAYTDVDSYVFEVDQDTLPGWWSDAIAARTEERMRERIRRMIMSKHKLLLGGCWIVTGESLVRAKSARLFVCKNAYVEMYGNSRAELYNSSRAELYNSSRAVLYDNSRAKLKSNSRAELWGNSHAELWGNSRAELYNSSSAVLYNSSSAVLYDNNRAKLYGNSSAELYSNSSAELKSSTATIIDRR